MWRENLESMIPEELPPTFEDDDGEEDLPPTYDEAMRPDTVL
jgi:hypothetical protein